MAHILSMSHGLPPQWTITIARVLAVIACSIASGSILPESGSTSAQTIRAPLETIGVLVAAQVIGEEMISASSAPSTAM